MEKHNTSQEEKKKKKKAEIDMVLKSKKLGISRMEISYH